MIDPASFEEISKVALLGFGRIAEVLYGPSLASAPVVSICEQRDDRQASILGIIPQALIVKAVADLDAPKDGTGVAFNLLPGPDHGRYSRHLLQMGWNVFTEKPAAASSAEWRELVATAKRCGRVIVAGPTTPYLDGVQRLRDPKAREGIGKLIEIHGVYFGGGPARRGYVDQSRQWFFGDQSCVVRDLAPYVMASLITILGAPSSLTWFRSEARSAVEVRPGGSVLPSFGPAATGVGMWGEVLGSISVGYHTWLQNVEAKLVLSGSNGEIEIDLEEAFVESHRPDTKVLLALAAMKNSMRNDNYWLHHVSMVDETLSAIMTAPGLNEAKVMAHGHSEF